MTFRPFFAMLALVLASATQAAEPPTFIGRASVIDGDTINIHGKRIRLHGIDAPESGQFCRDARDRNWHCGQKAALALDAEIGRRTVSCQITDTDRYGRYIGICSTGGVNMNAWMVEQGWAVAYRKYSRDYVAHEAHSKRAGLGIWQGRFTPPDRWRKGERLGSDTVSRADTGACAIKGNISSKGKRIYRLPGTKWYDRTKINEGKGERWFCSEAEARAAGWRRAR
ncbi:thermonuclease family protein [Shimia abyssi]|uniref:Endonuclease YncB(Thermonuclease family) n=1 Tax=Shimia abyssi TaxID=1662395 RepID=A0A2P8F2V8_9RHOB|nr:thermonuclease family protein [Shimia abyssi]PSL16054.1 endonuclease YncB(thermonuclease family) [Shimia abyssi]